MIHNMYFEDVVKFEYSRKKY